MEIVLRIVCTVNHPVLQCMYRLIVVYMCASVWYLYFILIPNTF